MRPTQARFSEMPGPVKAYNKWWGDKSQGVQLMKGVTQYSWSPFNQRAAKGALQGYLFNGFRRLSGEVGYWIVPFALGYGIYTWAKRTSEFMDSKAGHLAGHAGH
ncbi:hypothetical protein JAAARDRAFT_186443 [Jaapia argillacea MUCL 33604]|uniref:Cytochrome b-c1 complex subunit 8 n=1 Tax=Jaapia argillacea MUCL 33604 TaxID=933084 RepID=A0A067PGQ2_9AGAM|nr:hypothetical protein JAAARDRAFT_186443 [Jaapia argillacea MUCL 33604]